jgi:hypothetical protein
MPQPNHQLGMEHTSQATPQLPRQTVYPPQTAMSRWASSAAKLLSALASSFARLSYIQGISAAYRDLRKLQTQQAAAHS